MLKGISPIISPDLLATLSRMGHGDEIILADAHFPAETNNQNVIRADGVEIADLLDAIMPLFELDQYSGSPLIMMDAVEGDILDPSVEERYLQRIRIFDRRVNKVLRIERFAFYERTRKAFAVVVTGERSKYGNIILKKGIIE